MKRKLFQIVLCLQLLYLSATFPTPDGRVVDSHTLIDVHLLIGDNLALTESTFRNDLNKTATPNPFFRYAFKGCTSAQEASLTSTINAARQAVSPAILDASDVGTNPLPFQAWFGLGGKRQVGKSVWKTLDKVHSFARAPLLTPNFVCATPEMSNYWWKCQHMVTAFGQLPPAFSPPGGRSVVFCPSFWGIPTAPTSRFCMGVTPQNTWDGTAAPMARFQKYLIAHELIHVYLGKSSLGISTVPHEVYAPRDCMILAPADQLRNPENFQYYIASE